MLATAFASRRFEVRDAKKRDSFKKSFRRRESKQAIGHPDMTNEPTTTILEALLDGVWVIDARGLTTYVNGRLEEMLGYARGELLGMGFIDLVPQDQRSSAGASFERRKAGASERSEWRLLCKDGAHLPVLALTSPIYDHAGQMSGAVGIITDLTAQKAAEQKSQHTEQTFEYVMAQMPCVVWTLDLDLRFTTSVGAGLTSLGLEKGQVVGMHLYDYLGTNDPNFPPVKSALLALSGHANSFEQWWNTRYFQSNMEPLRDSAGKIVGTLAVSLDITERKQAEDARRDAHDELELRVQERTAELKQSEEHYRELAEVNRRLLAELNHRVRNNLFSLQTLVKLMRDQHADVTTFAGSMEARLGAMTAVHDLLAVEEWRPLEMATLVQRLVTELVAIAPHRAEMKITGPRVTISARKVMPLAMVIQELFTNSCKHGAHSVPGGRVRIEWQALGDASRVCLNWQESGGPAVTKSISPSLGLDLIRQFAAGELGGSAKLRFPPEGVDHQIEFSCT